jgi:predicted transcriptional regulator
MSEPVRKEQCFITVRVSKEYKSLLQGVATKQRRTVTSLVIEALEMLEDKYQATVEQVKAEKEI